MRLAGFFLKQLHHETPLFYKQNKILYFLFLQRSDFNNKFLTQLVQSNSLIFNYYLCDLKIINVILAFIF